MAVKQIMYIGKKPTKKDLANDVPDRVWRGLGDVQTVTENESLKLITPAFHDVFLDVTDMKEADRTKVVQKLREQFRAEQRAVTPAEDLTKALNSLSDEQLREELKRRNRQDGRADNNPVSPALIPPHPDRGGGKGNPEGAERPTKTTELIEDIAGAIVSLDKGKKEHYDSEGFPNIDAVKALLGYEISASELAAAVKAIKGA